MISANDNLEQTAALRRRKGTVPTEGTRGQPSPDELQPARVISVTSGKGGVGKTAMVANLAVAISRMKKKVLIIDADLSLANIDLVYGLTPLYNLNHFFCGLIGLNEIIIEGPGGVKILPAGSGLQQMTRLNPRQKAQFMEGLDRLDEQFDLVLIDTEAGISENVTYFNAAAQDVLVVATSDPTSISAAYTLMKVLFLQYRQRKFQLVVNLVRDPDEGPQVFHKLTVAAGRFPDISINYLGCIPCDENVPESLRRQKPFVDLYPDSSASVALRSLAAGLLSLPRDLRLKGSLQFFWKSYLSMGKTECL
jgi:flagellar biosynthesis protein FlhG